MREGLSPELLRRFLRRRVHGFFLLLQGQFFLGFGRPIRMVLMHGIFELFVVFFHMLFVLLLGQLVLILR